MAPATDNVAPRDSSESQCSGHTVSAPSAIDATTPQEEYSYSPRMDQVEQLGSDTIQATDSPSAPPLPTPPDYPAELSAMRTKAADIVVSQVLNNDLDDPTRARIKRYAEKWDLSPDRVIAAIAAAPDVLAPVFAEDSMKLGWHERRTLEYEKALAEHPTSPVMKVAKLPNKGPAAMYVTSKGVKYGSDLSSRMLKQGSSLTDSIDLNALVDNQTTGPWTVYQFLKNNNGEGGSQDMAFNSVAAWARAVKTMNKDLGEFGPAHSSIDKSGSTRPALFVAVLDGDFWTKERVERIKAIGRAVDSPIAGGFVVVDSNGLADLFEAVSKA